MAERQDKSTQVFLIRVSVIYLNFGETTKLVVGEEVETAILPEIRFNKAKHGG